MKAIVYTHYGAPEVLRYQDAPQPVPNADSLLVEVHAAAVNAGDWHLLRGAPHLVRLSSGLRRPKNPILGSDVAGRVVRVGANVTQFQPGDAVMGETSSAGFGAFAEYVAAPATAFVQKPVQLTFAQAAAVPQAALTALQSLRDAGQLQAGEHVLINGASGGVGTFAVQIARALGAKVTAVCSTRNVELVRALGAERVIDYTVEDYSEPGRRYDLILDIVANRPLGKLRQIMAPRGRYVCVGGAGYTFLKVMALAPLLSKKDGQRFAMFIQSSSQDDLRFLCQLIEAGSLVPAIEQAFPLAATAAAIRHVETGRARGKVVIVMR